MGGIGATSLFNLGSVFPQGRNVTQYQFVDDFSLTKGPHALKFGANYRRYDITDYTFSEYTNPLAYIGDQEQFFNGQALEYVQNFPTRLTQPVALWGIGLYAQDEWSVSKNLKLTFALRAEHNSNPVCQTNCSAQYTGPFAAESTDPNTPYNTMINANLHQIFRGTDTINWAPRFGFAWSPGNKSTVVRGGFGLFYDAFPAFIGDQFMVNLPGVVPITLCCNGYNWADPTSAGAGAQASSSAAAISAGFAGGASFNSLSAQLPGVFAPPNFTSQTGTFHTPLYQEWSLQLEQAVGDKASFALAYVGNHGIHEPTLNYPNVFASGVAGLPVSPLSGSYATVGEWTSSAVSNFNGLTASFNQRLTYGFSVTASYTWSHAMDEISNGGVLAYRRPASATKSTRSAWLAATTAMPITTSATRLTRRMFGRRRSSSATSTPMAHLAAGPSRRTSSPAPVCRLPYSTPPRALATTTPTFLTFLRKSSAEAPRLVRGAAPMASASASTP